MLSNNSLQVNLAGYCLYIRSICLICGRISPKRPKTIEYYDFWKNILMYGIFFVPLQTMQKNGKTTMAQIEDDYATSIIGDPNAC